MATRNLTQDERKIVKKVFPKKIRDYVRLNSTFFINALEPLTISGATQKDISHLVNDFLEGLQEIYSIRQQKGLFLFADQDKDSSYHKIFCQHQINGWSFRVSPFTPEYSKCGATNDFSYAFSNGGLPELLVVDSPIETRRRVLDFRKVKAMDKRFLFEGEDVTEDDVLDPTYYFTAGRVFYVKKNKHLLYVKKFNGRALDRMSGWNYDGRELCDDIGGMIDSEGHPQNRG